MTETIAFPKDFTDALKVAELVPALRDFNAESWHTTDEALRDVLEYYAGKPVMMFSATCVPASLSADVDITLAEVIHRPEVTELARTSDQQNAHYVKLVSGASIFLKMLYKKILPKEVHKWPEWTEFRPLALYHRIRTICLGSQDVTRDRQLTAVLQAVSAKYTPESMRTTIYSLTHLIDELKKTAPADVDVWERLLKERLIRHGHRQMEAHLVNTGVDPFSKEFQLDSLVASFQRVASATSTTSEVKARSTGVRKHAVAEASTSAGSQNSGDQSFSGKKKKRSPAVFPKGAVFKPEAAGQCTFCRRAHDTCRAKEWFSQVVKDYPESVLTLFEEGTRLVLPNGKEYTVNGLAYTASRDTSVTAPSLPPSGISATIDSSTFVPSDAPGAQFVVDSATDMHMTSHADWFHALEPIAANVTFADKAFSTQAEGIGTILLRVSPSTPGPDIAVTLTNVLYVPGLVDNLLTPKPTYGSQFGVHHGIGLLEVDGLCLPMTVDARRDLWLSAKVIQPLPETPEFVVKARATHSLTPTQFHLAFSHVRDVGASAEAIDNVELVADGDSGDDDTGDPEPCSHPAGFDIKSCETCLRTRMRRKPFPKKAVHPAKEKNERWVIDNVPQPLPGCDGQTNALLVLDEFTRFPLACLATFTREADELVPIIERCIRKFGAPVHARSDGEFAASSRYQDLCKSYGIHVEITVPYSGQQNGIAEARQGTIMARTRAILSESELPRNFWPWAVPFAAQVSAMCSTKKNSGAPVQSPYIAYFGEKPDVLFPHPFGALCFVLQRKEMRGGKLEDSSWPAVFLGTPPGVKGALVMYRDGKVDISHDVFFPTNYEKGRGAHELGLSACTPNDDTARAAELAQRHNDPDCPWQPDDGGAGEDASPLLSPNDLWLCDDTPRRDVRLPDDANAEESLDQPDPPLLENQGGPCGREPASTPRSENEPSLAHTSPNAVPRAEQPAGPQQAATSPSLVPEQPSQPLMTNLYSDAVETHVSTGAVIGKSRSGRTLQTPSSYWITSRNTTPGLDPGPCDVSQPFEQLDMVTVPEPAQPIPLGTKIDLHCRMSLAQPESQKGPDAPEVHYFRHSSGSMADVMKCAQPERYFKAFQLEMSSIFDRGVFEVGVLPSGEHALPSFTFFRDKYSPEGEYEKTKCRHVLRGDWQEWWQYNEIAAATLAHSEFRLFIAICASLGFDPFAADFTAAFLQTWMDENDIVWVKIYDWMEPFLPEEARQEIARLRAEGHTEIALRMVKTLYGSRQGPHNLLKATSKYLVAHGMEPCVKAPCLWRKKVDGRTVLVVGVFADDLGVGGEERARQEFLTYIQGCFEVGSVRRMTTYIGYKVNRDPVTGNIHLSMPERITQALDRFNLLHASTKPTPIVPSGKPLEFYVPKEGSEEAVKCEALPYAQLIGVLNYLSQTVRPDIMVAVRMLASFTKRPGVYHWKAAKRVLRYLKGTRHLGLCYRGGYPLELSGNSDASHGGNCYDSRTFCGFFTMLCGAPVNWGVKKQKQVPNSTSEAELVGIHHLANDVAGYRLLLQELGYEQRKPTSLQCDNISAIHWAHRSGRVEKVKHIRMKYHRVQELTADKEVVLSHLKSANMPADMLTKALAKETFERLRAFVMA